MTTSSSARRTLPEGSPVPAVPATAASTCARRGVLVTKQEHVQRSRVARQAVGIMEQHQHHEAEVVADVPSSAAVGSEMCAVYCWHLLSKCT
mmetsp:Transcript_3085/g.6713  ORF Transcript_3085/g.6713 Transcript_3085/m.6713 type:complete len:92 (+) Transcript_3085:1079-1354(+)